MEDRDKDVLQKNRMYLSKNIGKTQIVNVVNELYSQDILTNDDKELILSKAETSSNVFELLDKHQSKSVRINIKNGSFKVPTI